MVEADGSTEFLGVQPIQNKFLQGNYLAALEFASGFVFIRALSRQIIHFKPYNVVDTNGDAVFVAPQTTSGDINLRDPNALQDSLLFIPTNYPYQLLHVGIGIKPVQIKAYVRYPDASTVTGQWPNLNPINPQKGFDYGYFSSIESPYETPTDFTEMVIPENTQIGLEFFNSEPTGGNSYQPTLNILAANYEIQVLSPVQEPDKSLIYKIAARTVPAAYMVVGAFQDPLQFVFDKDWGVSPITIQQALALGSSGGS